MLSASTIRRISRHLKRPADIIEKDYVLEWLLYGIFHKDSGIKDLLSLKGGTAIRKAYFPAIWRFSEDLDFTVESGTEPEIITTGLEAACQISEAKTGIKYEGRAKIPPSGKAIMLRVNFAGPLGTRNSIKVDMSRTERMVEPPVMLNVAAAFEDLEDFPVRCYTLHEIASEKIRAMMQRTKARDYYDIWKLFSMKDSALDPGLVVDMVKLKCAFIDMEYDPSIIFEPSRLKAIGDYWDRMLGTMVIDELPTSGRVFDELSALLDFLPKAS